MFGTKKQNKIKSCLIQISVKDIDKSIEWYEKNLGMRLVSRSYEWKSATLTLAGVNYDICQPFSRLGKNLAKAKKNIGGFRGIFFYVGNIEKAYEEMKFNGVKFSKPPFKTPWGEYQAPFIDPDKNELSLCQS